LNKNYCFRKRPKLKLFDPLINPAKNLFIILPNPQNQFNSFEKSTQLKKQYKKISTEHKSIIKRILEIKDTLFVKLDFLKNVRNFFFDQ
jgi:hypothetical protein